MCRARTFLSGPGLRPAIVPAVLRGRSMTTIRSRGSASLALLCALAVAPACATTFQDARLVPRGQAEVSAVYGPAYFSAMGHTAHVSNAFGAIATVGAAPRANIGIAYAHIRLAGAAADVGPGGVNFLAFGPKIGIVPDRVALLLPVSFGFGNHVDTASSFELHPTVVFTKAATPHLDINPSVSWLLPFCGGCSRKVIRVAMGVGIKTSDARIVARPEFGILFNPGEPGVFWLLGAGVSFRVGK